MGFSAGKRIQTAVVLLGALSPGVLEGRADVPGKIKLDVQKEVARLLQAKTYPELIALTHNWGKAAETTQKRLLAALLRRCCSTKPLDLGPAPVLRHNPKTEGGRCRWAVESLVPVALPPAKGEKSDSGECVPCAQLYEVVIQAMALPRRAADPLAAAPKDRMRLAESQGVSPEDLRMLDILAGDPDPQVRLRVAKNRFTQGPTLLRLERDSDPQVRRAAVANLLDVSPRFFPAPKPK